MTTLFDEERPVGSELATTRPSLPATATNPLQIYSTLVAQGVAPGELRELLALTREHEANEAAKAFANALTTFQSKCPPIRKTREATITGTRSSYKYNFASYDDVMRQIGALLTECGLALSFSTENQDKGIRVTLKIRHGTHVEPHTLDVPVPTMNVNDTQRYGAALSYAKRYALCAALNIVVTDEDDDAQSAVEPISDVQARDLEAFIDQHEIDKAAFLNWLDVQTIADIPAHRLDNAWAGLRQKVKASR